MHLPVIIAGALAATVVMAHPGHDIRAEAAELRETLGMMARADLSHCAEKIKARGLEVRAIARRTELASRLAKKSGIIAGRDFGTVLKTSHHSNESYTLKTPASELFGSNNSCILSPEVTEGPYYVSGEYVRKNVIEDQPGVPLTLDLQVLDMETCDPVPNVYLEIWHCNSTGVYSGVAANGNGNGDGSNIDATFLRGVQKTDQDGVSLFETLFPGHYQGRAPHIHVMVHHNASARANGTLEDTTASHVGQVYFDQALINAVESTSVYKANTQALLLNENDFLFAEGARTSDPVVNYVTLGKNIEDGLLGWIAFGINSTMVREVHAATTLYKEGGKANEGGIGGPGGPGGPPPPGFSGFPTGFPPVPTAVPQA
ncbi:Intradiol ring-cleavage dioxygenase [Apodospora peruviana]|uniref:Intradiol ring-cleavage dioxygenase n=1 Tax=Apodospora peruviana TaxID=516989 RepID=A0AAE0I0J2_9PEZI|nr:Intradiol ring-cleavage dioxygenase [Apodospora peruviana]